MDPIIRFIAASGITNLGDGIAVAVWPWMASLLTRDALLIALVPFALRLPWFLAALPAGVITDRVDRKRLILWADTARGLAFLGCGLAVIAAPMPGLATGSDAGPGPLYLALIAAAAIVGTAEVFRDNAAQTMLPALVPHARLEVANGRLWAVETLGNGLAGPALGAAMIALALPMPFLGNAALYGVALLLVVPLAVPARPRPARAKFHVELGEGYRFLAGAPLLRLLAVVTGTWNLAFQIAFVGLVLHAQENLGLSAPGFGLVLSAGAVGGILGVLAGDRIARRLGPARTTQATLLLSGLCFLAMPLAPSGPWLGLTLAVFQAAGMVWNIVSVSYRQRRIPDALLGRVNSLYRLIAWGMMPVGAVLSGVLVTLAEGALPRDTALTVPFWVAGAIGVALACAAAPALGRGEWSRTAA
ncbi:MFS transporter [Mesobaculum littorinae]|uniref:MFS transporter n=1 Tax=Mesobaculum littorinae TaxID=2486419 RepID=A0A438AH38_9RHOB|nr:MFS transporter [Mesobaculum littorinae]RVV98029.1 MFS transporter [Mesobaculum littorinae]